MFFGSAAQLAQHVHATHTFPARRGTLAHHKVRKKVMQRFQEGLPTVPPRGDDFMNKYTKKWVVMQYNAAGDQKGEGEVEIEGGVEVEGECKVLIDTRYT